MRIDKDDISVYIRVDKVNKALEIDGISLILGETEVLKDVDLRLSKGDFLGIVGPNGGGKTTLLKIILGLQEPDSGKVKIFGKEPRRARDRVSYVPQHTDFDSQFPINVWNVVLMGRVGKLGWRPFFSSKDKEIAQKALEKVEMEDYKERQISDLSGGEQQRVLLARALTTEPDILLLDEPTASVDERIKKSIYELLRDLNQNNDTTIVLVSHDIGILSSYVKKIGCLNGELIYHGHSELTHQMIEESYGCEMDIISHHHEKEV